LQFLRLIGVLVYGKVNQWNRASDNYIIPWTFLTVIYLAPFVAFRINCGTSFGWDRSEAWLENGE